MAGCGSSSTSHAEAEAVAVAEHGFLAKWRSAEKVGTVQCAGKYGLVGLHCNEAVVPPLQVKAMVEFSKSIEALLDGGVGPECADALMEAQVTMNSVPSFPDETVIICRAESRQ
jgi:hypothetical protein